MPEILDADEIAEFRGLVEELGMPDQGTLLVYAATLNQYNEEVVTYTPSGIYPCRFDPAKSRERSLRAGDGGDNRVVTDAQVRLPLTVEGVVRPADRFQITHRFGIALDRAPIYDIVGEPQVELPAVVVDLQEVRQ